MMPAESRQSRVGRLWIQTPNKLFSNQTVRFLETRSIWINLL